MTKYILLCLTSLLVLSACGGAEPAADALRMSAQPDPKLLYYGWDTPTPAAVVDQAARLDGSVFDAVVFKHSGPEQIFTHEPLPQAAFDEDIAALQQMGAKKLSESFLRLQVNTEDGWDWTSEADWEAFKQNLRNYARVALEGGLKGILLDPEPYGFNVWNYETQPAKGQTSFKEIETLARARGAEFMRTLKTEYPGITVFSLKMFSQSLYALEGNPSPEEVRTFIETNTFDGLWYGFANGMVSELDSQVKLIDGNEASYYYLSAADFDQGKADSYGKLATAFLEPSNARLYREHVEVVHPGYLDGILNLANSPQFFGYYLADDDERLRMFEHNTYSGLKSSPGYFWIYAELMRWWDDENVPPSLEPRLKRAKDNIVAGHPLGFDTGFIGVAKSAFDAKVDIYGSILPNIPATTFKLTGLPDSACGTYNNGGRYHCVFPAGSTVTVTPVADGVTFDPPSYTYTKITKDTRPDKPFDQDFSAH